MTSATTPLVPAAGAAAAAGPVLAVDIGGTKFAAALVDAAGGVLASHVVPTPRSADAEDVFAAVTALAGHLLPAAAPRPAGVGISSAGPLDSARGTVSPVNIGAWRDFPLRSRVADLVAGLTGAPVPVVLAGDGICMAIGEHWLGAGRGAGAVLGVVVSTGVGGGLVLDGHVHAGPTANAGHIGHMTVDVDGDPCPCGGRGCLEVVASGPSLVRHARRHGWAAPEGATAREPAADAGAGF
ncbi:ROK family protein, partial [Kineococcus glutinatus]|uniref:ROK family protein n=1 Tax=Kineococcus glutinatus TaxID=1070872 RepID=UPI0031E55436